MRRHCGCVHSQINCDRIDVVDISKEVFALADFYSGINYSNRCAIRACTRSFRMDDFFSKPARKSTTLFREPHRRKCRAVNLYTQEFFSLMRPIKRNGIATFWLPINQLKVEETRHPASVSQCVPNTLVWVVPIRTGL